MKGRESYLYANYIITQPSIKLINNRYVASYSNWRGIPDVSSSSCRHLVEMTDMAHSETKTRKPVDNTHYLIQ